MEIKISKCASKCCVCEHPFVHEQKVHSVATMDTEFLARKDYCSDCSPKEKEANHFCAWETQYSDPKVLEAEHQEVLSPLRRLFYELAASAVRLELAQAFLAAQLLKRQRAFRQIRESEDGDGAARTTLYLDRATNRLIEACDLNFTYAELDEARIALLDQLRLLESPEPPPDTAVTPEPLSEEQTGKTGSQTPEENEGEHVI